MKLINHIEESLTIGITIDSGDIKRELSNLSDELRMVEDKFYKIFDLNPLPMSITLLSNQKIIDVNNAFLDILGYCDKKDVINMASVDLGIIEKNDREKLLAMIIEKGEYKNYFCNFKTSKGKKIKGLFSGMIIELNNQKCLLMICQIINQKCILDIFKTFCKF